jgi:hypothetical protein
MPTSLALADLQSRIIANSSTVPTVNPWTSYASGRCERVGWDD